LGAKFTAEKVVSAPTEAEQKPSFKFLEEIGEDLGGGRGYLGSFSVCLEGDD